MRDWLLTPQAWRRILEWRRLVVGGQQHLQPSRGLNESRRKGYTVASITRDGPGPVLRVTVEFREGHWRIIDRFQVPEMTISSSDDLPPEIDGRHVVDTWFDVLNAEGDIVYRKRMMAPPHSVEMFHPDGSMSRVIVESRPFSNDLLIPDLPEIESLHLYVDHPVPLRGVDREGTLEPVAVFPAREEGGKRPKGRR